MPAPQKNRPFIPASGGGHQKVPAHAPKRELNVRLALTSLIVLVVLVPSAWGWHYFQVSQQTRTILRRARALAESDEHGRALRFYRQYLMVVPDDVKVHTELAQSLDALAQDNPLQLRAASEAYARVLGMAANDVQSKLRYAEILAEMGESEASLRNSREILKSHGEDTDEGKAALRLRALALLSRGVLTDAVSPDTEVRIAAESAIRANGNDVDLPFEYAKYLRAFPRTPERKTLENHADNVMDAMLRRNDSNPDAYANLYQYRRQFGLSNIDVDLDVALASFPDDARFVVFKAQRQIVEGQLEDSLQTYQKALTIDPENRGAYLGLAALYRQRNDLEQAKQLLLDGLEAVDKKDVLLRLELADVSIDLGDLDLATSTIDELAKYVALVGGNLQPIVRLDLEAMVATLQGRLAMANDNGRAAIGYFENALRRTKAEGISEESRLNRRRMLLRQLASLYDSFREWDRVTGYYNELIALDPSDPTWRIQKAYAQQKTGQWARAATTYQLAIGLEGCPPQTHYDYARALMMAESTVAKGRRSWARFQEALATAQSLTPSVYTHVLMAEYHLINGDRLAALESLRKAEEELPRDAPAADRFLLANIYRRLGRTADVERIAEQIHSLDPTNTESLLVRADQLWQKGNQEEAVQLINDAIAADQISKQDQSRLLVGLGELQRSVGDWAAAEKAYRQAIELESGNFAPYSKLGLILADQKRWEEYDEMVAELTKLEGDVGTVWRELKISGRLAHEEVTRRDVQVMKRLVEEIRDLRPTWPRTYTLLGEIELAAQDPTEAIKHFQRAYQLGDRTPEMFRTVIRLLSNAGRIDEAQNYSLRFASHWPSLQDSPLSVAQKLQEQANETSIAKARKHLEDNPTQAVAYTRLAQLLIFAGKAEEAKPILEKATQRFPDQPSMWIALFNAYVALSDREGAEQTLRHIAAAKVLSGADLYLALAQGHQLLGNTSEAEANYLEALRLAPYNSVTLNLAVRFFLGQKNEEGLRKSVETTKNDGAKRAMALLLASRGGDENWDEAIRILAEDANAKDDPKNLRMQAMIYARRGSATHRRTAIRLLEKIIQPTIDKPGVGTTPNDYALLFSLYRDAGEAEKASAALDTGLTQFTDDLSLLSVAFDFAIVQGELDKATDYLGRMASIRNEPEVISGPKAGLLHAQGKSAEAKAEIARLLKTAENPDKSANEQRIVRLACAGIYEKIEAYDEAEQLLKELVAGNEVSKKPLVGFYLRRRRENDALDAALTQSAGQMSRTDFILLCSLVSYADPLAEYRAKVNAILGEGLIRWGKEPDVLFAIATLNYMRGEIPQAIDLFERLLRISPDNIAALNNLALILAEAPGRSTEALELIDRAIEKSGPQPNLVDTKGLIYLAREDFVAATQSFQEAVYQVRNPIYLLHLAEAQRLAGNANSAKTSLEQAILAGLDTTPLNLLDQQIYKNLVNLRTP